MSLISKVNPMKLKSLEKKKELADLENLLKVAREQRRKLVQIILNHIHISQKLCSTIGLPQFRNFYILLCNKNWILQIVFQLQNHFIFRCSAFDLNISVFCKQLFNNLLKNLQKRKFCHKNLSLVQVSFFCFTFAFFHYFQSQKFLKQQLEMEFQFT